MSELLRELSSGGVPSKFQKEIAKSALHIIYQSNNKELINLDSIIEFDSIIEQSEDNKLISAEKIFSKVEAGKIDDSKNNNNEEIYL
jgi:hypothetical protein